jgi:hypothetical protein
MLKPIMTGFPDGVSADVAVGAANIIVIAAAIHALAGNRFAFGNMLSPT